MGIRRRFSSLSGNNGAIPSSTSSSQNRSKTSTKSTAATNSTPSLLILQKSSKTTPKVEADENGNSVEENEGVVERVDTNGGFNVATNLEAYKQRCRALEAENRRLMNSQAKLIQDSNRRMEAHLEEMRQLKEAMEHQKRENVKLAHLAQKLEGDSSKAKELAREWQRIGQFNNRLIQRELQCFQTRVELLEMKCVKLTGENVELKRLCLYLDKQRQTLWQQLAQKNNAEQNGRGPVALPAADQQQNQDGGERGECSSGCGSSAVSTPSTSNSVNSLEDGLTTIDGNRRVEAEDNNVNLSVTNQIHVDGEQEKTLQSICSEMMQSSMLLGQLELANPPGDNSNKNGQQNFERRENIVVVANGHRRIVSPKILDYYDGEEEQFVQANLIETLPPTVEFDQKCNIENNVLEQSAIESSSSSGSENNHNNTSSTSPCSSSFGTTAQFGSSFCSSSADDTAILVLDMDEQQHSQTNFTINSVNANLNGMGGGLEVRELCTISEEEGDESEDCLKLMKLEQLERMKVVKQGGGSEGDVSKESILEELLIRRRTTTSSTATIEQQLASINAATAANGGGGNLSLSSSLLAQAGSMLTSIMDDAGAQQMSRSAAPQILAQQPEGNDVADGANSGDGGNNRNSSSSTTGSSTSSGAFSGTSGRSSGNKAIGRGLMELFDEPDDDLPPKMPLISQTHRLLPSMLKNNRPASFLEATTNVPANSMPSIPSSTQQQRSTLPRAAATNNLPSNGQQQHLHRPSSVIGQQQQHMQQRPMHPPDYSSLNSSKNSGISPRPNKKMTLQSAMVSKGPPPVRIRVRPPPIVQTNFTQMEHKIVKNKISNSLDHPQPFPIHLSMPKMKSEADVTSL